ncbi:hypothetical protein [Nocardia sp. NPDC057227]|uniref:DUF7373 family lipoprotein n=1 Tax=Nocardia sp. NPDC057227 TaxID=3346056 RepID=UPI003643EBC2
MTVRRRRRVLALLLGAITLVAGCGRVDGTPAPAEIDVRALDVGTYSTTPLEYRFAYDHSLFGAKRLAAMRLADTMVLGNEIDATFRYSGGKEPILDRQDVEDVLADVNGPVTERNKLLVGYSIVVSDAELRGVSNPESTRMGITVLQFPDAATAERTAAEIDQTDFAVAADQNQKVSVPNIPAAHAHWRPGVPTLAATLARGAYVVVVLAATPKPELGLLADLARRGLENQARLLDSVPPLSGEDALRLPNDPNGILNRTLNPEADGDPSLLSQASFTRRGMLTQMGKQYERAQVLDKAYVDQFAISGVTGSTLMFRAGSAESAQSLGRPVLEWGDYTVPLDAPDVPGVQCGARATERAVTLRYRCTVPYQRYLASVESDQVVDVHQRAAAQYALLANTY